MSSEGQVDEIDEWCNDENFTDEEEEDAPALCTFAATGTTASFQPIFVCLDCAKTKEEGVCICRFCADICHLGHDLIYIAMGPAYCDCQHLGNNCRLQEASLAEALRLGIPPGGIKGHVAPNEGEYVQQVFTIPSLQDSRRCDRLVRESSELIVHTRDTHWLDLQSKPDEKYCKLEELAMDILQRHVKEFQLWDKSAPFKGGAEWWVQVKPVSLPSSEESTVDHAFNNDEGVDLHYDKDEDLASSFDIGSFPTLSTVTYLTDTPNASPTIVFPHTYDKGEGEVIDEMLVSYPRRGKHLVFDGRLLHGAPAHYALRSMNEHDDSVKSSNAVRCTFLVNIWVNGPPTGVKPLVSPVRQQIRKAAKPKGINNILERNSGIEFETMRIECIELEKEECLPEPIRGRIELPFVSKGATWIGRVQGAELVVVTFPPPPSQGDTVKVKFGSGVQAYLEYKSLEDEELPAEEPYAEDYV